MVTESVSSVVSFRVIAWLEDVLVKEVGDIVVVADVVPVPSETVPDALTCSGKPEALALAVTTKLLPAVTDVVGAVVVMVVDAPVSYIVIVLRLVFAPVVSVTEVEIVKGSATPEVVGAVSVMSFIANSTVAPPGIKTPPDVAAE